MKQPHIYLFYGTAGIFFRDLTMLFTAIASIISMMVL